MRLAGVLSGLKDASAVFQEASHSEELGDTKAPITSLLPCSCGERIIFPSSG